MARFSEWQLDGRNKVWVQTHFLSLRVKLHFIKMKKKLYCRSNIAEKPTQSHDFELLRQL